MSRILMSSLVAVLALAACSSAGADATPIGATLADYSIELSADEVAAGPLSFEIVNTGDLTHELEVFEGDTDGITVDKGVAVTSSLTLVDEVEDIIPGGEPTLTLDLDPGTYVILCNLPEHYEKGMVTTLTVTP